MHNECPCCTHTLIKCLRKNEVYWFCQSCYQEMPNMRSVLWEKETLTKEFNWHLDSLEKIITGQGKNKVVNQA